MSQPTAWHAMDRTLRTAQARFAIEDIMFRYAEAIDTADLETLAQLFHGATINLPGDIAMQGYQEILDGYENGIVFYDAAEQPTPYQRRECFSRTRHVTTNLNFEFDTEVTSAEVCSYFTVYQNLGGKNELIIGGRYVDRFARGIQGWHVVERSMHFDNPGDLSRHLAEPGA